MCDKSHVSQVPRAKHANRKSLIMEPTNTMKPTPEAASEGKPDEINKDGRRQPWRSIGVLSKAGDSAEDFMTVQNTQCGNCGKYYCACSAHVAA